MHTRQDHQAGTGHHDRTSARWRAAAAATTVIAAAALALTAGAVPASAAGGYTVTATIPVDSAPIGVGVDPAAGTVYVASFVGDGVSVISEATNTVTDTINLYGHAWDVAVDPVAGTVYVTHFYDQTVSVIDTGTNTVTATIPGLSYPEGVAVDPAAGTVYVANDGDDTVSVISEATNNVTATIPVGPVPVGVAVDPAAGIVYVTNSGADGTVSVINAANNTVTATIPVGSAPSGVAVDPAAGTVYVANDGDNTVSVINAGTNTVTATIPVGSAPGGVAVDPSTRTAYVANNADSTVSVISADLPVPVTAVGSSQDPSTFGQKVTFTATIAPADAGGTITFTDGSTVLCSAVPLTHAGGSTYKAKCATTALPVGADTITTAYSGDTSYAASAGTLTQTVAQAPTALTARFGTSHKDLTLTAKLTASGHPVSGQPVSFSTGTTPLCTPDTSADGEATCTLTAAQTALAEQDGDTIQASYPGNANYQPSSASLTPP